MEEKLEYTEKKLSNEKEHIEILEIKVDEYEKKLKSISDTKVLMIYNLRNQVF